MRMVDSGKANLTPTILKSYVGSNSPLSTRVERGKQGVRSKRFEYS